MLTWLPLLQIEARLLLITMISDGSFIWMTLVFGLRRFKIWNGACLSPRSNNSLTSASVAINASLDLAR